MKADGSGAMFDGVAPRYDRLNRLTSLGMDQLWRRALMRALPPKQGGPWLDVACGTGDVLRALIRSGRPAMGLDPSPGMLEHARDKVDAPLILGDVRAMPFPDAHFEGITIAFGVRNFPERPRALAELARVLRPGGCLAILEVGQPPKGALGAPQRAYVRHVLPRLGALALDPEAYAYLSSSVQAFDPEALVAEMGEAGFSGARARRLGLGVVSLITATRG